MIDQELNVVTVLKTIQKVKAGITAIMENDLVKTNRMIDIYLN